MLAPIALFVYNRPEHTQRTLEALSHNEFAKNSTLYVFCDGPKPNADTNTLENIKRVTETVKKKQWCKEVIIIKSEINKGLANSIISGVTEIVNRYGKIIVLEDDIITAKSFLSYMNTALDLYQEEKRVMHISSYLPHTNSYLPLPETFFISFMSCWGWATWARAWNHFNNDASYLYDQVVHPQRIKKFNLDGAISFHKQLEQNIQGTINTWAIKWFVSIFLKNGLCLYPKNPLSDNIGLDGTGTHCNQAVIVTKFKFSNSVRVEPIAIKESCRGRNYLIRFYRYGQNSNLSKIWVIYLKKIRKKVFNLIKKLKQFEQITPSN